MSLLALARKEAREASGHARLEARIIALDRRLDRAEGILAELYRNAARMTADSPEAVRDMIYDAFEARR